MSSLQLLLDLAEELDKLKVPQRNTIRAYPHCRYNHPAYHYHFAVPEGKCPSETNKNNNTDSTIGKQGFQVSMDVQQFLPNELTVKTIDSFIVIEGKHEEREDEQGYISRHFIRKYPIPDGCDPLLTISSLSSDGILTVTIPKPTSAVDKSNERIIHIQQTGPAHLSVKQNHPVGEGKSENMEDDNNE